MPLAKEIEFPLFHLGTYTSASGTPVTFTDALLRQMAKNTNFILGTKVLQAPIGYDHPAGGSDAHGVLTGARYENGTLFAKGTNWSDRLVDDVKRASRLAYSGEFHEKFTYPAGDGSGKMIEVGPAVVGLAILGKDRPAVKNLKPLAEFQFGEGVPLADAYETREELRKSGLLAEYCDGTHFFGEVANDERRFFSEETHMPLTAEDLAAIGQLVAKSEERTTAKITEIETKTSAQITAMSEAGQRKASILAFCETARAEKPFLKSLGQLCTANFHALALNPNDATFKAFVESIPATMVPLGRSGEKKAGENAAADDDEPKALADLRPKHFAEMETPAAQEKIAAGLVAFAEFKPDTVKGAENDPAALTMRLRDYVTRRDTAAAN